MVYIISGRDGDFLMEHLGHIENLGMSAEHGCFLKAPGVSEWTSLTDEMNLDWKKDVLQIFSCASPSLVHDALCDGSNHLLNAIAQITKLELWDRL